MSEKWVRLEVADGVGLVTMDRPPVNALNREMRRQLVATFDAISEREDIRCAVLTGSGEKAFAAIQPQWKTLMHEAHGPLQAAQDQALARRQAMIEEAKALAAEPVLRVAAVKALQQRWQADAQQIALDRKHEQKLWDAFRKPIDDAFQQTKGG